MSANSRKSGAAGTRKTSIAAKAAALFSRGSVILSKRQSEAGLRRAAQCFLAAAKLGYAPAQYYIGSMYAEGKGVERSPKQAQSWTAKADKQKGPTPSLRAIGRREVEDDIPPDAGFYWWRDVSEATEGNPAFARYWPEFRLRYGPVPEIAWLYELGARIEGRYALGVPFSELTEEQYQRVILSAWHSMPSLRPRQPLPLRVGNQALVENASDRWSLPETLRINLAARDCDIADALMDLVRSLRGKAGVKSPAAQATVGEVRKHREWSWVESLDDVNAEKLSSQQSKRRARARAFFRENRLRYLATFALG